METKNRKLEITGAIRPESMPSRDFLGIGRLDYIKSPNLAHRVRGILLM